MRFHRCFDSRPAAPVTLRGPIATAADVDGLGDLMCHRPTEGAKLGMFHRYARMTGDPANPQMWAPARNDDGRQASATRPATTDRGDDTLTALGEGAGHLGPRRGRRALCAQPSPC